MDDYNGKSLKWMIQGYPHLWYLWKPPNRATIAHGLWQISHDISIVCFLTQNWGNCDTLGLTKPLKENTVFLEVIHGKATMYTYI